MNNKVLIIGSDHHNTLGLIESLAQRGVKPYVIVYSHDKVPYLKYSKNYTQLWVCDTEDGIIECMLSNFEDKTNKTIVLSSADVVSVFLDYHYKELNDYFILPISARYGELERIMSKQYMAELAIKVGITVPRTWLTDDTKIPEGIEYPCITKAISSIAGAKDNIAICQNEEDLKHFLNDTHHCESILIQKFIDKAFEFQFLGCSLNNGNEIIIKGRTNIDRPNGIENTFFLSFDIYEPEFEALVEKVKQFIKETQYNGPFSVEFLRGKDGVNYFTEMNFRNDGNAYCQTAAGINIPYIMYLYYSGGDYIQELNNSEVHKVYLMPEVSYTRCMLLGEFGFKEWWRNMKKADCYTTYFKNDSRLFYRFLYIQIRDVVRNKTKRIFGK